MSPSYSSSPLLLLADRGNFIVLNGPKGFFASVFGKKDEEPPNPRLMLLSDKALYSFIFELGKIKQ